MKNSSKNQTSASKLPLDSSFIFDKEHENLLDKVLEQSLKEVNDGKVIPHEVAMKQAAQLLSERPEWIFTSYATQKRILNHVLV